MKIRKRSTVVLASCGDGATNTGSFHEAMNFASVQKLPLVLLIENNGYAFSTPNSRQFAVQHLSERAAAYGMPGESVDGNDVLAVMDVVRKAVDHARNGNGPMLIESKTFRVPGHSEADRADYVPDELREEWLAKDPIARFEAYLTQNQCFTIREKADIEARIKTIVDDAVRFAEQSPPPDVETVADYVFAPDGPVAIIGEPEATHPRYVNALDTRTGLPFTTVGQAEEAVGRR